MIITETGTSFLGYTAIKRCTNCSNTTHMTIRQEYYKQTYIVIKTKPSYGNVFLICPICETSEKILGFAFRGSSKIEAMGNRVISELESGKDKTKLWIATLSAKEKEAILKRLNDLGAYGLVKYYSDIKIM